MSNEFVEYVLDCMEGFGSLSARKMFGGFGLYIGKQIFAIIVDNELYFKADKLLGEEYAQQGSYPFTYEREGKKIALSYYLVPISVIEDKESLKSWFNRSMKVAKSLQAKVSRKK